MSGGQHYIGEQDSPHTHNLNYSRDSVTNDEHASSLSSVEDLNIGKGTTPPHESLPSNVGLSEECYANPVDAINEFLQGKEAEFGSLMEGEVNAAPKSSISRETGIIAQSPTVKSPGEEASSQVQQASKELQLQLFHERLFKDHISAADQQTPSNGSSEVDTESIHNRNHDYSEIDDEPTYSNPFDALAESTYRPPYRVKTDKLKRNVSLSATVIQHSKPPQLGQQCSNSPPPPPLPLKDEMAAAGGFSCRPVRYARRGSGENELRGVSAVVRSGSTASVSSMQPQQQQPHHVWEWHEPVWKRNNSRRGSDDSAFMPQRAGTAPDEEKPEAPLSVAERLRQLRQRSQSDGLPLEEVRPNPRPPMPLPVSERESARSETSVGRGQVRLNGQSHHMSNVTGGGGKGKMSPARQKAWLERTVSDQHQSVYYARRGMAQVVPLSAREIVKQHISHAAS